MANSSPTDETPKRRKLRWRYRLLILLLLLAAGLMWLNGPGLRWLAPKIAVHYLEKAGLEGSFRLRGSATGGLTLEDLELSGKTGALARLSVQRLRVDYAPREVIKGNIRSIRGNGIHADLRLGEPKEEEDKPPLDLEALVRTIQSVRTKVVPVEIDLQNVSMEATKEQERLISLASSRLSHAAGSDDFRLDLGEIAALSNLTLPPQSSQITWQESQLALDRLDPYPSLGVRNLVIQLPAASAPDASAELHFAEAVFMLQTTGGLSAAVLDLREGQLVIEDLLRDLGLDLPAQGRLTSLTVQGESLLPGSGEPVGEVKLVLEDAAWADWKAPEAVLAVQLHESHATLSLRAQALDTSLELDAAVPLTRQESQWSLGEATGSFLIRDIQRLIPALAEKVPALKAEPLVPTSALNGNFRVEFDQRVPRSAETDIHLTPADAAAASSLDIQARWRPNEPLTAEARLDGLTLQGSYELPTRRYQGTLALDSFRNARIDPWLAAVGVALPGQADLTARWAGSGDLTAQTHQGDLSLSRATWQQPEQPLIEAAGEFRYQWPDSVHAEGLTVQSGSQKIALAAEWADQWLKLNRFLWHDGDTEMASGTGSLPLPEDFSQWRKTLAEDTRPLQLTLESKVIPLTQLQQWLPAASQLDPESTGQVRLSLAGTYSDPELDSSIDLLHLKVPENDAVPSTDLRLTLQTQEDRLVLAGTARAADIAPAVIHADVPFRPAVWAEQPDRIKQEPLAARIELPSIGLDRFTALVPMVKRLNGTLTGHITVAGTVETPDIQGQLRLAGGAIAFQNSDLPDIDGATLALHFTPQQIRLETLRASIASGILQASGQVGLDGAKPSQLDVQLSGDHLPLLRNDMMIVRANANLRVQGPWETAALSGSVRLVDSLFFKDIEILPIGSPFTAPSAAKLPKIDAAPNPMPSIPEPFRHWPVDLTLRTEEPFLIRGNLATGQVDASVRVRGTLGNPAPDGRVRISDVVATLPLSRLNIHRGTITFTPETGFDPSLEIRGTAEPRPYRIDAYVYGRASNPQLILTSNPPLPENEIMTLLATGTTTSGLENPQAASARALQLLAEEIRRGRVPMSRQLRPLLGVLDRVDFSLAEADPYSNTSLSTATLTLTDRFLLSAGMGQDGNTRVLGIWRISFR